MRICAECKGIIPRTAHFRIIRKEFCGLKCQQAFADRDIRERAREYNVDYVADWDGAHRASAIPRHV